MTPIKKILFCILALLLLLVLLEKLYDFFLLQNKNIKTSYVAKIQIDASILIHGSCVPVWTISPEALNRQTGLKTYNLAQSHSDFADNYLQLYLYLKNNKAPEYIFLHVTPESFDEDYNAFNSYKFAPFLSDTAVKSIVNYCDPNYMRWTMIPFMKYAYYNNNINSNVIQGAIHFFTHKKLPYFADGYEPPFDIWKKDGKGFVEIYPAGKNFEWSPQREFYFKKLIKFALSKNIKIFLFESPVYTEAAKQQPNRPQFIARIKSIATELHVDYLNFDTMKISESKSNFRSTISLNEKSAKEFNAIFGKYIKQNICK